MNIVFNPAGKIVDAYDDPSFLQSKLHLTTPGTHYLTSGAIEKLSNHAFALVMDSPAGVLRKLPVYNDGMTDVSTEYFLQNKDILPEELQKVAGSNLRLAYETQERPVPRELLSYDSPNKGLVKVAFSQIDLEFCNAVDVLSLTQGMEDLFNALNPLEKVAMAVEVLETIGADLPQAMQDYLPKDSIGPHYKKQVVFREQLVAPGDLLGESLVKQANSASNSKEAIAALLALDSYANIDVKERRLMDPYKAVYSGSRGTSEIEKRASLEKLDLEGQPIADQDFESLTTQDHLHLLRNKYPAGTVKYASEAKTTPVSKLPNYLKARKIHFCEPS